MRRSQALTAQLRGQEGRMSVLGEGGVIVTTNPRTGSITFTGSHGRQETPAHHPYIGPTSWFRVNPERTTKVVVRYRGEDLQPYVSGYVAEDIQGAGVQSLLEATAQGNFYFRVLNEGEMQATSPGIADVSWLDSGNLELRGGATTLTLNNKNLEITAVSPVHRQRTLGSKTQSIGNEQRFGVVTRNSPLDATQVTVVSSLGEHAKEYLRNITMQGVSVPLVDHREGLVIEDTGIPATLNGVRVRVRTEYGTLSGQKVALTIDETGNVAVTVPQASLGFQMQTLLSDMKFTSGKNFNLIVTSNFVASAQKFQFTAPQIQLGGTFKLLTQNWQGSLNAVNAVPAATSTGDVVVAYNALRAWAISIASAFPGALTTITGAG